VVGLPASQAGHNIENYARTMGGLFCVGQPTSVDVLSCVSELQCNSKHTKYACQNWNTVSQQHRTQWHAFKTAWSALAHSCPQIGPIVAYREAQTHTPSLPHITASLASSAACRRAEKKLTPNLSQQTMCQLPSIGTSVQIPKPTAINSAECQ
jgi:hypothetical protein